MVTRAQSKAQTREALILAGLALFRDQGPDAPSLDAICESAGKTRGAFYVHFADRDAFMVAVMEHILLGYLATIVTTAEPAGDLERSIHRFADEVLALSDGLAHPGQSAAGQGASHLRLLLEGVHRSPPVRERFIALLGVGTDQLATAIASAQRAGTVRAASSPEAIARVLVGQVFGLLALLEAGATDPEYIHSVRDALLSLLRDPSQ